MGNTIDELFFTGDQRIDIVGHLIKRYAQALKAGTTVKMKAFTQMSFTKTLCGGFESEHFLPVRAHPDQYREGQ